MASCTTSAAAASKAGVCGDSVRRRARCFAHYQTMDKCGECKHGPGVCLTHKAVQEQCARCRLDGACAAHRQFMHCDTCPKQFFSVKDWRPCRLHAFHIIGCAACGEHTVWPPARNCVVLVFKLPPQIRPVQVSPFQFQQRPTTITARAKATPAA